MGEPSVPKRGLPKTHSIPQNGPSKAVQSIPQKPLKSLALPSKGSPAASHDPPAACRRRRWRSSRAVAWQWWTGLSPQKRWPRRRVGGPVGCHEPCVLRMERNWGSVERQVDSTGALWQGKAAQPKPKKRVAEGKQGHFQQCERLLLAPAFRMLV